MSRPVDLSAIERRLAGDPMLPLWVRADLAALIARVRSLEADAADLARLADDGGPVD